jgi:hypothetical protein
MVILIAWSLCCLSCGDRQGALPEETMSIAGETYVKLALAVGRYDEAYIDSYHGPAKWQEEVDAEGRGLDEIAAQAGELLAQLEALPASEDEMLDLRHRFLISQLQSLRAYVEILQGTSLSFDKEFEALYGAVAPHFPDSLLEDTLDQLDELLPGEGPLGIRLQDYRARFLIPQDRIEDVMRTTIAEVRRRTLAHITLPATEDLALELVPEAPWGAYSQYKGDFRSLIQINASLPIRVDDAIWLAAHEGYPGHHVDSTVTDRELVRDRGWFEHAVWPFFSPKTLVGEGIAEYAMDLVFPLENRARFAEQKLFPLAGIEGEDAKLYFQIQDLAGYFWAAEASAAVARRYLDGEITAAEAIPLTVDTALVDEALAEMYIDFWDEFRTYVANYPVGRRMVREYIERHADSPDEQWQQFERLLSLPRVPSLLKE